MTPTEIAWQRSTYCANNACVEVGREDGYFLLRDSKNPHQPPIRFTPAEWEDFMNNIRFGDLAVM